MRSNRGGATWLAKPQAGWGVWMRVSGGFFCKRSQRAPTTPSREARRYAPLLPMRSLPTQGRKTSGMMIEPSGCWQFSRIAIRAQLTPDAGWSAPCLSTSLSPCLDFFAVAKNRRLNRRGFCGEPQANGLPRDGRLWPRHFGRWVRWGESPSWRLRTVRPGLIVQLSPIA